MLVTIDTNVLYQALYSTAGASNEILRLIRKGSVRLALSHAVLLEYEAVLTRPGSLRRFGMTEGEVAGVVRYLASVSEKFEPSFLFRPNLRDEDDNMFVELAVTSRCRFLVTSNVRDYRDGQLLFASFGVVTPAEFMQIWRKTHVKG
jgi:putative PIN family toxin of toxin-antitoxin system